MPKLRRCAGTSGRQGLRVPREFEVRPEKIWLSMFDGQRPELSHLSRLRAARSGPAGVQVKKDEAGLVCFDTSQMRLIFDSARGFCPVQAEFQTKPDQVAHPEYMLPVREDYELAQDSHGQWYCRQMVRTAWPRGGKGDPVVTHFARILEYDSQPSPDRQRFSFDSLKLPIGTSVSSNIIGHAGAWVVGHEGEGSKAVSEREFRELGEKLKTRGFAAPATLD
jgi:hypothetical protein